MLHAINWFTTVYCCLVGLLLHTLLSYTPGVPLNRSHGAPYKFTYRLLLNTTLNALPSRTGYSKITLNMEGEVKGHLAIVNTSFLQIIKHLQLHGYQMCGDASTRDSKTKKSLPLSTACDIFTTIVYSTARSRVDDQQCNTSELPEHRVFERQTRCIVRGKICASLSA